MAPYHLNAFYSGGAGMTPASVRPSVIVREKHLRRSHASFKERSGFYRGLLALVPFTARQHTDLLSMTNCFSIYVL